MQFQFPRRFSSPLALLAALTVVLSPAAVLVASGAQSQSEASPSVAEIARKARAEREARKKSQKPVKELTDDDLARQEGPITGGEPAPAKPATEQATAPEQPPAAETAEEAATEPEAAAKKLAEQEAELKELKAQLATAQKDAEIQQRDLALQKEQFYSQTDFAHDSDGKARLDAGENQLSDKKQEIEKLKTKIAALQELIDRAKKSSPSPR